MARTLQINYGSLTVGLTPSDANIYLTDRYESSEDRERFVVRFTVVITAATSAALITAEQHLADELSTPDQSLTIVMGATRHSYVPGSNTGFLTRGLCRKTAASDTDHSSEWDCEVVALLPEDTAGRDGRRDASVRVEQDESERQVAVFSGSYTALAANSASAQMEASLDTWVDTVLTALGGTWNKLGREWEYDDEDKVLTFVDRREKILLDESTAGTDHASVVNQQLKVIRRSFGEKRATSLPDTTPFTFVAVAYSASIRSSATGPAGLKGLWEDTLRAHVLDQANAEIVIRRERVEYDKANNRITALIEGRELASGVIESRATVTASVDPGVVLLPRWDGNPYSRARDQGLADHVVEVLVTTLTVFGADPRVGRAVPGYLTPDRWEQVFYRVASDDFTMGLSDGTVQDYTARTDLFVFVRRDATDAPESGDEAPQGRVPTTSFNPDNVPSLDEVVGDGEVVPLPF